MKRLIAILACFVLLATMIIVPEASSQERRKRSRFGRKARTAAIIAGGAGVGALIGGKKGAAIGALAGGGGSALYTYKLRKRTRNY